MADNTLECRLESRTVVLDEDEVLVAAAQEDPEAAGRLYDKYYDAILGYIYHATLDAAVTEDLTSNVFVAALTHLGRYRWRQIPFRAWLYRIASNEIRMHYRRRKYGRTAGRQAQRSASEAAAPSADESPAAAEEYRLLHKALLQLRLTYRTVIILRYFEDKTIAEISSITGRRQGTIKSQLHRGLARLQDILTRQGLLPDELGTES
jgi:RNA polymerase sigma-70 factor (ECF subfamily)